jgi:hypothetical protein
MQKIINTDYQNFTSMKEQIGNTYFGKKSEIKQANRTAPMRRLNYFFDIKVTKQLKFPDKN